MSEHAEDLELLIDDYLDDRMAPEQRVSFEERMGKDPELRSRVNSATRSVDLVQQALGWVTREIKCSARSQKWEGLGQRDRVPGATYLAIAR